MRKILSAALLAGVGLVAATLSRPAHAGAYVGVSVGVPVPGVAVVPPPVIAYAPPYYYYGGPRVIYPGPVRYGYGVPYGYRYGFRGGYAGWHGGWHGRR
jgi:hypothetical protein